MEIHGEVIEHPFEVSHHVYVALLEGVQHRHQHPAGMGLGIGLRAEADLEGLQEGIHFS